MKTLVLGAALALMAGVAAGQPGAPVQPTVTGVWEGQVKVDKEQLPLIFHLGDKVSGDSPAERLFDDPGKLEQAGDKYKVTFQSGGEFEGALGKDGKLTGVFSKGAFSAPLVLERQAAPKP